MSKGQREQLKILAAAPSADQLLVAATLLRGSFPGASVHTTSDVEGALEEAARGEVSALFATLGTVDLRGRSICSRLREDAATRSIACFILVDGTETARQRIEVLEKGADELLSLGADHEEIAVRVRTAMARREQADGLRDAIFDLDDEVRQQALRRARAEQQYQALFDAVGDAIITSYPGPDGTLGPIRSINRQAVALLGYSQEELRALTFGELLAPGEPAAEIASCNWIVREGHRLYETRLRCKSGRLISVEVHERVAALSSATAIVAVVRETTARRSVEREARIFKRIADTSQNGMVLVDTQGIVRYTNATFAALCERVPFTLVGKQLETVLGPLESARVHQLLAQVRRTGRAGPVRVEVRRGGGFRTLLLQGSSADENGGGDLVITAMDVTELEEASRRLTASEEQYRMIFSEMLSGMAVHEMIFDEDGRPADYLFLDVNPAFETLTGLAREAVIGRRVKEVIPEVEPVWIERYGRVVRTGESLSFVEESRPLGKSYVVTAFRNAPGQFACSFMDITHRVQAERQFEELYQVERLVVSVSRALVGAPMERLGEVIAQALAETGEFLEAAWVHFVRLEAEPGRLSVDLEWRAEGRPSLVPLFASPHAGDYPWLMQMFQETALVELADTARLPEEAVEERRITRSLGVGAALWAPLRGADGTPLGALAVAWPEAVQEFTTTHRFATRGIADLLRRSLERQAAAQEQERMRSQLERVQRLKAVGTLAAGVAHEVNNPINIILNYVSLLEEDLPAEDQARESLHAIGEAANRVASIVRNLLSFSRHEEEQLRTLLPAVRPLADGVALFRRLIEKSGVLLEESLPVDLPPILANAGQLQQVVINLLSNALDALTEAGPRNGEKGRIRIAAQVAGENVRVEVANNGPAIPEGLRGRIFEPFFTTKKDYRGTGLGLSISHGIVQDHGGRLSLEEREGEIVFVVSLPIAREDGQPAHNDPEDARS